MAKASCIETDLYDYIELKFYDVHGRKRGRIITQSRLPNVLECGMGLRKGLAYESLTGMSNRHPYFTNEKLRSNMKLAPILSTLKPCQKSVYGHRKVGSVLCELRYPEDGSLDTTSPREVTQAMLQKLQSEFGLDVKSSFEVEFGIRNLETQKLDHGRQWASLAVLELGQDYLLGLLDDLRDIGVKVDTLLTERGAGQYELTFELVDGIEAADMVVEFRTAAYVNLKKKGYLPEFMACVDTKELNQSGFHYNFSLWDRTGTNAFVNPGNPSELSQFGRHWLAGLIEHAPALTAFSSPTVNCYRRLETESAAQFVNWAFERRYSTFQLKIDPGKNTYIENRLPSSACSPHLVMACTIAAGMDGVRRELPLPEQLDISRRLPSTLEKALEALDADTHLKEILGPKMVELFIFTKRKFELEHFKSLGDLSEEEMLLKEKEYYYEAY